MSTAVSRLLLLLSLVLAAPALASSSSARALENRIWGSNFARTTCTGPQHDSTPGTHWAKADSPTILASECLLAPKGTVKGYRAVSKAEADDIAKHGFRPKPEGRSMQDKWFSESRQGAEAFKRDSRYSDLTDIVEADVPKSVYDRSFKHPNIDNTGPGFCVACEDLPLVTPR